MLVNFWIFDADRSGTSAFLLPSRVIDSRNGRSRGLRSGFWFEQRRQRLLKRLSGLRQHHTILRPLGPGETGLHCGKIKREQFRIFRLRGLLVVKQSLLAAVGLD